MALLSSTSLISASSDRPRVAAATSGRPAFWACNDTACEKRRSRRGQGELKKVDQNTSAIVAIAIRPENHMNISAGSRVAREANFKIREKMNSAIMAINTPAIPTSPKTGERNSAIIIAAAEARPTTPIAHRVAGATRIACLKRFRGFNPPNGDVSSVFSIDRCSSDGGFIEILQSNQLAERHAAPHHGCR